MSTLQRRVSLIALAAVALLVTAPAAFSQSGEAGFSGGGSFYLNRTVDSPSGNATVGFKPGFHGSAWLGQTISPRLSGEVRYTFGYNKLKLDAPSAGEYTFGGQTHAVHYNLLIHGGTDEDSVRPFVAAGGGVKGFYGTGEEIADQPGQQIAILTRTSDWKPLVVFGGGVKIQAGRRVQVRLEVYDYFSQVPGNVIAAAPGAVLGGWFHNIVPSVGVSFTF